MEPSFVPGLELSGLFYEEVVAPILEETFPNLVYSAALIGHGSEVLGFDTVRSTDHEWGPRLLLFVPDEELDALHDPIYALLAQRLPGGFRGYSTNFSQPQSDGTSVLEARTDAPINHKVLVLSASRYFIQRLGIDPLAGLSAADWLAIPQQRLFEMTAGRVYYDGLNEIAPRREILSYYPRDVWLYLMACQWRRIEQQEPFVGRTGEVDDEVGSRLITATLVRDVMKLCFLIERRYAPYTKWFGTAFNRLKSAEALNPILGRVFSAESWQERESNLCEAFEAVARLHNGLGVTPPLEARVSRFHGRPFNVIHGDRFVSALSDEIGDPAVRSIVEPVGWVGAVDQFSDTVDVLENPDTLRALRAIYD
jgi:hypothetical protein